MKITLQILMCFFSITAFANVKIDISNRLTSVTENIVINGLDENTEEGVIFITESLHLEGGARIMLRNACLIILGDISGTGIIDVDDTATVTLEGEKRGRITFTTNLLADATCQQSLGVETFKDITDVPEGLTYSLYTLSGRLLDKSKVDDYIKYNFIDSKTYLIKIEGYKLRKIQFKD
ncbi:hypothetical protein GCM10022393_22920 [Aquimarina addita]|uniref:DUF4402 domain-containing protein n=1 Tax=Aquimarina addita TaxID=870485 RepID=A0ABP6UJE1_9FLAO